MRLIDYYDADGWGENDDSPFPLPRQQAARDLVLNALSAIGSATPVVLDVGCGDGSFLHYLAAHVEGRALRYLGVENSEYQLAKAARLPYEFHKADLGEGIPLPDGYVDLVHAAEVIEHLYDPDLLVDECARVLRPGGHLVVTTPNLHAWYNRALFVAGVQPIFYETSSRSTEVGAGPLRRLKQSTRPVGHLRLLHRTALVDLLKRGGFAPVTIRGARFHGVPKALRGLDAIFCRRPSLASILVVHASRT